MQGFHLPWSKHTAAVRTAAWQLTPILFYYEFQAAEHRSGLYVNNGDVMETAAVQTSAVSLGHYICVEIHL